MGQLGYGKMGGIDGWDWSFWFELVVKLGCGVAKECRNLDVCIKQRLKRHGKRWGGGGRRGFIEQHTHGSETQSLLFQYDDER